VIRRAAFVLAVIAAALTVVSLAGAAGSPHQARIVGLFTITGGGCMPSGCTDAMSGVVRLTSAAGKSYRVRVDRRDRLRRSAGRFRLALPPGSYAIGDQVSSARGGGTCPIFRSMRDLGLPSNPFKSLTKITVIAQRPTYLRINCFGH
jgi:hypothetical protein